MAMNDADEPRPPARRVTPLALDLLGVSELTAYIEELEDEIARVRGEMGRKEAHRLAAQSFFKSPG